MKNNNNKKMGVINEQGFVAGYGLGFNTLNEQDQERLKNIRDKEKEDKKNNK